MRISEIIWGILDEALLLGDFEVSNIDDLRGVRIETRLNMFNPQPCQGDGVY
jgi:hypothetical protein